MKIYVPDYYENFHCISRECKHSCCIGWEIDVDKSTLEKYKNLNNDFGNYICSNINYTVDDSSIILDEKEKCPFLNEDKLCELILNLGEDYLCQICKDHPRYRNFYTDRIEMGIGLCCEEAARIILSQDSPFSLKLYDDDGIISKSLEEESEFYNIRDCILGIIQNRQYSIEERVNILVEKFKINTEKKTLVQWCEFYSSLEILDEKWLNLLDRLKFSKSNITPDNFQLYGENLLCYFIYRHLSNALLDGAISKWLSFAILSYNMILELVKMEYHSFDDIVEYSRLYSSEIEYSQENIDAIINEI